MNTRNPHLTGECGISAAHSDEDHAAEVKVKEDLAKRLLAIIERAEYAGRQDGISKATRSQKRSVAAREMADISSRMARQMADQLVADVTR